MKGVTGETVAIRRAPDLDEAKKKLQARHRLARELTKGALLFSSQIASVLTCISYEIAKTRPPFKTVMGLRSNTDDV